jgi:enolase-phosphatase E1
LATLPDKKPVRAILLDIEGTTTPADFVYRTLFPFARRRLEEFLRAHQHEPGVREDLDGLRMQHHADLAANLEPPAWLDDSPGASLASSINYAHWLMDRDSKYSALKSLQGKIWQEGYQRGELRGEVYPDVPDALSRWRQQSKDVFIFSSGSVLAQKNLFSTTSAGDLTRFIRAFFDTTIGPKRDPQSYSRIAASLVSPPEAILFISDVAQELDAARLAGMQTALCVRSSPSAMPETNHRVILTFDGVSP